MSSSKKSGSPLSAAVGRNPLEELDLPSPLLLGSGSFTRKLILKEMGIPFEKTVKAIDEKALGDRGGNPSELVLLLARAKGDYLVQDMMSGKVDLDLPAPTNKPLSQVLKEPGTAGYLVLTADQVVTHDKNILEKPESIDEAKVFVNGYAKSPPSTVGAVVITHIPSLLQVEGVDTAQINFKPSIADANLIEELLKDEAPVLDCAGGLMVEHPLVREHLESIDGTEDSVMGLSKDLVIQLLTEMKQKLSGNK
jgi:septum formation protein